MSKRFASFAEFWPFYVREHSLPITRALHVFGTTLVAGCLVGAVATGHWWLLAAAPVVGYGFAWTGHFGFEKNRPATFKYPFYSFAADWVLWAKTLTGQMGAEAERILGTGQTRSR
jgi:hypothetical protein